MGYSKRERPTSARAGPFLDPCTGWGGGLSRSQVFLSLTGFSLLNLCESGTSKGSRVSVGEEQSSLRWWPQD